jgi:hypothetical protein
MLEDRAGDTLAHVRRLRRAFKSRQLIVALLAVDSPPEARLVVCAARDFGVPTLVVQHGFVNEPRWTNPDLTVADTAGVWSEVDARDLRARRSGGVVVTGNPGVDDAAQLRDRARPQGASGHTLVLVEYSSRMSTRVDDRVSIRHVNAALRALAAARPHTVVTIRPHPAEHEPEIFERAASRELGLEIRVDTRSSIQDLLRRADLCVGALSTATLQAGAGGVPVIYLNVTGRKAQWPFDGSTDVPIATTSEQLVATIPRVLAATPVPGREAMLEALGAKDDAIDRIVELVRATAESETSAAGAT